MCQLTIKNGISSVAGSKMDQVHFTLCKWASSASPESSSKECKFDEDELLHRKSYNPESTHHGDDNGNYCVFVYHLVHCFTRIGVTSL